MAEVVLHVGNSKRWGGGQLGAHYTVELRRHRDRNSSQPPALAIWTWKGLGFERPRLIRRALKVPKL